MTDVARTGRAGLQTASVVVQRCCTVVRRLSEQGVACSSGSSVVCPLRVRRLILSVRPIGSARRVGGAVGPPSVAPPRRSSRGCAMLGFVIGTGRCGSTLVHEVLARHSEVGFVSNLDDKLSTLDLDGRWNNVLLRRAAPRDPRLGPFRDRPRLVERGRLRVAPSEGWQVLERQVSPILSRPHRDLLASDATRWLEARLRRFFERRMAAQGRPVFLHHVTGWPRAGLLHAVFPDARFIHVVRDGRAVANSLLQTSWWTGHQGPSNWDFGPLPEPYAKEWEASGQSYVLLAG